MRNANVPNERSFQGLLKTCNLSLLSVPEAEKNGLKRPKPLSESYTGNSKKFFVYSYIRLSLSLFQQPYYSWKRFSLLGLGNHATRGFSDAVVALVLQLIEQLNQCIPR